MSLNSVLLSQAQDTAGLKNQTEVQSGGGREMAAAGRAPARLIGYVETGLQPQPDFKGTPKPPANEIVLTFEVFGTKNTKEIEDKDTKVKRKVGALLTVNITEKLNEKAKFKKLFDKMRRGRDSITHITQMLNEVFMVEVRHGVGKASKKPYATIQAEDGSFMINGPVVDRINEEGEVIGQIDVTKSTPQASFPLRMFKVDAPSIEQWLSIKMEGTYTKKTKAEDGTEIEEEVSKNYLQEKIKSSLNWEGSAMQAILMGLDEEPDYQPEGQAYDDLPPETDDEEVPVEAPKEEPKAAAKPPAKKSSAASATQSSASKTATTEPTAQKTAPKKTTSPSKAAPAPADDVADDLAALGL